VNIAPFLESEGGKMAVIIFMLLWLSAIAVGMVVSGHTPQETGRVLLSNAFTGLMTLLIAKLGDKKAPPPGGPSA
jgi:hypothetical protein